MAILCDDCKSLKPTYDLQVAKVLFGHCQAIEYPFLLGIFKEARLGAFTAPKDCKFFQEKKKK
ncbi:MAG: hypothetical protein L6277_03730 [Desulfobacterales bacterium]|nr:hypothetical protein [Pseudomonadota bacterium]MBU4356297.1 hypothetical protein [Pseudomonadota bacterium]MCG2771184.1 hypothetical protein [Desulfobacterales bacterium]